MKIKILLFFFFSFLMKSYSQTREQYDNMNKLNEESRRFEMWTSYQTDTSIFYAFDSYYDHFKPTPHHDFLLEFNGSLEDGIANLMNIPSCVISSFSQKKKIYIRYKIHIPYTMSKNKMYESAKDMMLNFLEKEYLFQFREMPDYHERPCWVFRVKDETKLPKYGIKYEGKEVFDRPTAWNGIIYQWGDTTEIYGSLSNAKHVIEMRSKCFALFQIPFNLKIRIPNSVFFDFRKTKDFFEQYGIEVLQSTVEYNEFYLDFH